MLVQIDLISDVYMALHWLACPSPLQVTKQPADQLAWSADARALHKLLNTLCKVAFALTGFVKPIPSSKVP